MIDLELGRKMTEVRVGFYEGARLGRLRVGLVRDTSLYMLSSMFSQLHRIATFR